ncbi:hypothetical protein LUW74_08320 [Actinomadura madurae]|uniref:hypothetical protein n=1 Tax=Actinomadura madurae TaxID=1993 RepID=UPI002025B69B|nr:hypothetical protein [Actinomadura madurae]URN03342.1 hypothetical protein LUW74_08320 [Actinomadura madurae]
MAEEKDGDGPILVVGLNFPGVYNPLRSMVAEIARLGAGDVYFCSTDDRADDIESISDDDSVRFVSLGPAKPGHNPAEWDQERYEELHPPSRLGSFSAYVRNADFDYVRELYRRVDRVFDEVRPRLVLLESMCTFAMDAAMLRGIPFIISQPNPVSALMADRLPWSYPTPLSGLPLRMTLVQKVENVLFRIARGILMARPASSAGPSRSSRSARPWACRTPRWHRAAMWTRRRRWWATRSSAWSTRSRRRPRTSGCTGR